VDELTVGEVGVLGAHFLKSEVLEGGFGDALADSATVSFGHCCESGVARFEGDVGFDVTDVEIERLLFEEFPK